MDYEVIRKGLNILDDRGKNVEAPIGMVISFTAEQASSRMMKLKPVEVKTVVKEVKKKSRKSKK